MSKFTSTIHHKCDECGSEFSIKFNENEVEDSPHLCPFCGTYILDSEIEIDLED